ncbi:hypothetical protein BYT27DRAFT_7187511 [Phlegmacium glaucopus]|nr:hypothetical protein BYT27DRAFT_7187511 [Phlegmacium glaucopus]
MPACLLTPIEFHVLLLENVGTGFLMDSITIRTTYLLEIVSSMTHPFSHTPTR